jgi:ADP-ribose pyrophosphatase
MIAPEEREQMPKKAKAAKAAKPRKTKAIKPKAKKAAKPKASKVLKPKAARKLKPKAAKKQKPKAAKKAAKALAPVVEETAHLVNSETVFEGKVFRVVRDEIIEPGGKDVTREIIRHNGSVVILAIDNSRSKHDPWIVMERQYRYAANQFLWELPAGKLEPGEDAVTGAKRELEEETGYRAKKWKPLVKYFASPGFVGESMNVFLAEGLVAGAAHPEYDEQIELRLVKMSEVLKMIAKGAILDGKTLSGVLLYARKIAGKHGK